MSKAVVISIDRWQAGFLGLYGNPWVDTPSLDAFAVGAAVFDQHFAENLSADAAQHAWWTGRNQFPLNLEQQRREPVWLPWLSASGVATMLLHDPAARLPIDAKLFATSRSVSLKDAEQLHFEEAAPRFVKLAVSQIQQMSQRPDQSELLWIHASGLPVDARSLAYDELYAEDAPQPTSRATRRIDTDADSDDELDADDIDDAELEADFDAADESDEHEDKETDEDEMIVFPPRFWRRARSSPRELADAQLRAAGWEPPLSHEKSSPPSDGGQSQVNWQTRRDLYSAQATQWDAWFGRILEAALQLGKSAPVMIVFTAAAGEHLGEHADQSEPPVLYEESIHVPLMIRIPDADPFAGRRLDLTSAADLPATLLDWFEVAIPSSTELDGTSLLPGIRDDQSLTREIVLVGNDTHIGVRGKDFYFRRNLEIGADGESIFVKPDDRWDADNMLKQLPDAAEKFRADWQAYVERFRTRSSLTETMTSGR